MEFVEFAATPSSWFDGFPQFLVVIPDGRDITEVMQMLSAGQTMVAWTVMVTGFIERFAIINYLGIRVEYHGVGRWQIASLHTLSDTRLYLLAIRRDGGDPHDQLQWAFGVVDGELLASGRVVMVAERAMRIPSLMNLLG